MADEPIEVEEKVSDAESAATLEKIAQKLEKLAKDLRDHKVKRVEMYQYGNDVGGEIRYLYVDDGEDEEDDEPESPEQAN